MVCVPTVLYRPPSRLIAYLRKVLCEYYIFCVFHLDLHGNSMSSVNLIIIIESLRVIIDKKGNGLVPFHLPSIIAVAVALGKCLG